MLEIIQSGGWLMLPIVLCSIVAMAIIFERFWALREKYVVPRDTMPRVIRWIKQEQLSQENLTSLRKSSPLGQILAEGLAYRHHSLESVQNHIEDAGRNTVLQLERYLNTLGTIASITPLLGLLGTVVGMIRVFSTIVNSGVGSPGILAGGISEALITTAAGLSVAIPTLICYRVFQRRIDVFSATMQQEAQRLVSVLRGPKAAGME